MTIYRQIIYNHRKNTKHKMPHILNKMKSWITDGQRRQNTRKITSDLKKGWPTP